MTDVHIQGPQPDSLYKCIGPMVWAAATAGIFILIIIKLF